jgi:hypothetical protein
MNPMPPSERAQIEWACTHLTHRFAQLLDARRFEALAALFTEDGAFARPSAPDEVVRGRDRILAAYQARPAGKATRHIITNTAIEVDGPDAARGVCYILLYTATPVQGAGPLKADPVQAIGEYRDRFVREAGEWKFAERLGSVSMLTVP